MEYYNKEEIRQLTIKDIEEAVAKIEKYRIEQEMKSPVMQYFADNVELGREVLKWLKEFTYCIKNPDYFNARYGGVSLPKITNINFTDIKEEAMGKLSFYPNFCEPNI